MISLNAFSQDLSEELKEKYKQKIAYKKNVYNKTLIFINENPDSPGLATLYFQLAEMSTEIDVNKPDITLEYYRKARELNPDFLNKPAILYNIGYYVYESEVNKRNESRLENIDLVINWPDSLRLSEEKLQYAIEAYKEILEGYPDSPYSTETAYRLGVIYFDIAIDARVSKSYYQKAIEYFNQVAQKKGDPLEHLGLFQRGWTYFSSTEFEKAIEDFSLILEIINEDSIKTKKTFFEADAIDNIAYSLIEYDGTDFERFSIASEKAKEVFHNFVNEDYGKEVILKSVELKLKYNAPMQAIDLYNAYISLYSTSQDCPTFIDSIVTIYKKYPSRTREGKSAEDLIINEYVRLIEEYKVDSLWFQINSEKEIIPQLEVIKKSYEFLEPKYYNDFAESKSSEDYVKYKDLADNYCKFNVFADEKGLAIMEKMRKNVVNLSQDLAETTQDPKYYFSTINDIEEFIQNNPNLPNIGEYKEIIFYNYEKIYEILKPVVIEQPYVDSTMNITITRDDLDSIFVQATVNYENFLTETAEAGKIKESELIRIIYQRAELRYDREEFDKTFDDFTRLLKYNINDDIRKITYARLAEISQQRNDYAQAESFYREAAKYATDEEKQDLNNNILATIQSKANTLSDSSDYVSAAQEYLRLADELETEDLEQSLGFIIKAIESYEKADKYQTAINLYLGIASKKEEKSEILAAYLSAWTISDSLQDWDQSVTLRKQFINKFSDSNEAYKLHLQITAFYEGEQFNDKAKAAEMYMQLYNNADKIDIGEDSKESIFLNAYRLYQELDNKNKIVELSLEFEKLYPNHPKANEFLIVVAKIYKDGGEEEKFEKIAAYLIKKDPSIDLLSEIAVEKLKTIKIEIDSLFNAKQYDLMYIQIDKFKEADEHYKHEGLELPTEGLYETFQYYEDYLTFGKRFNEYLENIEKGFLSRSSGDLIRVNEKTEWKKHLIEGKKRIEKLMEECDGYKAEIIALIQEGNSYDLPIQDRTKALYIGGKIYDYGAKVAQIQIKKFVDVSDQLNSDALKQNPVQQKQYKTAILNHGNKIALDFTKKAVQLYNTLLATFYDGKNYSDEWTDLTNNRLVELHVRKPKIYENIYTNSEWKINNSEIRDYASSKNISSLWDNVKISSDSLVFKFAEVIEIPNGMDVFLSTSLEAEIIPELITIEYSYNKPVQILIDDVPVEAESTLENDMIEINGVSASCYSISFIPDIQSGTDFIVFKLEKDTSLQSSTQFASSITLQYDKEKLELFKTTEKRYLFSDYTWYSKREGDETSEPETNTNIETADSLTSQDSLDSQQDSLAYAQADNVTETDTSSEWKLVAEANFKFFKSQMYGMENSEAFSIWYPEIDSNNVETVYFKKEINIDNEVFNASAKFIAQNSVSIWINDELVIDSQDLLVDDKLKKVMSHEISVTQLKPGKNIILAKVIGGKEYKGFIFSMEYIVKK